MYIHFQCVRTAVQSVLNIFQRIVRPTLATWVGRDHCVHSITPCMECRNGERAPPTLLWNQQRCKEKSQVQHEQVSRFREKTCSVAPALKLFSNPLKCLHFTPFLAEWQVRFANLCFFRLNRTDSVRGFWLLRPSVTPVNLRFSGSAGALAE